MVSVLDVNAVHSLSSAQMTEVLQGELAPRGSPARSGIIQALRDKYIKFFADMRIDAYAKDWPGCDVIEKLYTAVCELRSSKRFSARISEDVLRGSCAYPAMVMPYRSLEDKVKVAHTTAIFVTIDDISTNSSDGSDHDKFMEDLRLFHLKACDAEGYKKLYPNRGPVHPILEEMISCLLTDLSPFYKQPRHQNTLIKGTLDFIEACQLENMYNASTKGLEVTEEMVLLPDFLRRKSGLPDVFVLFQLSGPELVPEKFRTNDSYADQERFFYRHVYAIFAELAESPNTMNDYLSLYKEFQAGESSSYVNMCAERKKISPLEVIDELSAVILDLKSRTMTLVERSGCFELKEAVVQYFEGSIHWHLWFNKRYKLKEILADGH